jgi:DNA (cytosine-5)-methyltransferase 1
MMTPAHSKHDIAITPAVVATVRRRAYTVGTGFSGIGVPDLCARLLGMRTVWQIEREPFCQKVLRKNFPEVETLYGDIFDVHQPAYTDIQVYGFPCQPFSIAGKQLAEKDERFLIPEMLRIIDESRPRVVVLENVPHFAKLAHGHSFKSLLQALAQMGFDAEWGHIRAEDYGAPHERERWFLVAYASGARCQRYSGTERMGTQFTGAHHARTLRGGAYEGVSQSRLGRNLDGFADWMDGFVPYPARPGEPQHAYEPPRVTTRTDDRAARLKALGNSMAVDVIFEIMLSIRTWLEAIDNELEAA